MRRTDALSDALIARQFPRAVRVRVRHDPTSAPSFWRGIVWGFCISGATCVLGYLTGVLVLR
jgi:hypothetical protein